MTKHVHTALQFIAIIMIAAAILHLTQNIGWAGLFLGAAILSWSALAELASARPFINSQADINLREVP